MKKSIRQSFRQMNRRARRRMQEAAAEEAAAAVRHLSSKSKPSLDSSWDPLQGARLSPTPGEGEEGEASASPKKEASPSPRKSPKRVTMKDSPRRPTPDPDDLKSGTRDPLIPLTKLVGCRPVERAVIARADSPAGPAEQMTSLVRSLVFANTHVTSPTAATPSFWVNDQPTLSAMRKAEEGRLG